MKTCIPFLVLIGATLLGPAVIRAQSNKVDATEAGVPRLVQFNGTLKDATARPVTGVASVTFAIYAEQDGGTALWSETQNVIADANGHFNALLGGATAAGMPAELFGTGQSRWLGVTIARQPEMPRVLLASVPYALKAGDAATLGGLPASAYVTTQSLAAKSSTPASTTILAPGSTTIPSTLETSAQSAASPAAIPQATPTGGGTTNFIPLWTSATALGNSLLFQTGGKIGVGTTTPTETLDVNGNSIFRGSFQLPPGHDATASSGFESHSFQFQASSFNSSTKASTTQSFGFRAEPLNNNTTNPSAQLDLFFIPNGGSSFVNTGVSWSSTGIMTFAPGQSFNGASETLTGSLSLPNTTNSGGLISFGGNPFISDYGSPLNTFVGAEAGGASETAAGGSNTAIGGDALFHDTTGGGNVAVGVGAMQTNTQGGLNVAAGYDALTSNISGSTNVAIGQYSGFTNTTGSNNVFLGSDADAGSADLTYATAIGAGAIVGESNAIVLGGTQSSVVNVGIGTPTPQSMLELSSATSSVRATPAPQITLTNTAGGAGANVSLDFNTSAPIYGSGYNPSARIAVIDTGGFTDGFEFESNKTGKDNNGLVVTMSIDPGGNVTTTGNLDVGGTLTKKAGSFKIDDPIDPANKYLSHSFVESPDMMNIYNGNAILDAHGRAVIQMPKWFDALNRDFRYQLTAIGAPGPRLYIATEIHDNRFQIAGGKPGMKVSWMVTGIRHDAWADAHRIPVEEEKPANEQGHYLSPELFGAPPEKSISSKHGNPVPVSAAVDPATSRSAAVHPVALRAKTASKSASAAGAEAHAHSTGGN